jgi:hypothetical protein
VQENTKKIPAGTTNFFLLRNVKTDSWAQTTSYSLANGVASRSHSGRGVMLTTHIHLVLSLKMSGAQPLIPLHAFITRTGALLLLLLVTVLHLSAHVTITALTGVARPLTPGARYHNGRA